MTSLLNILIPLLIIVESDGNDLAINANKDRRGCLQISEAVVADVNRVYGTDFTWDDAWDREKSIRICKLYLGYWGWENASLEKYARIWNGGPRGAQRDSTLSYWTRVYTLLNTGEKLKDPDSGTSLASE